MTRGRSRISRGSGLSLTFLITMFALATLGARAGRADATPRGSACDNALFVRSEVDSSDLGLHHRVSAEGLIALLDARTGEVTARLSANVLVAGVNEECEVVASSARPLTKNGTTGGVDTPSPSSQGLESTHDPVQVAAALLGMVWEEGGHVMVGPNGHKRVTHTEREHTEVLAGTGATVRRRTTMEAALVRGAVREVTGHVDSYTTAQLTPTTEAKDIHVRVSARVRPAVPADRSRVAQVAVAHAPSVGADVETREPSFDSPLTAFLETETELASSQMSHGVMDTVKKAAGKVGIPLPDDLPDDPAKLEGYLYTKIREWIVRKFPFVDQALWKTVEEAKEKAPELIAAIPKSKEDAIAFCKDPDRIGKVARPILLKLGFAEEIDPVATHEGSLPIDPSILSVVDTDAESKDNEMLRAAVKSTLKIRPTTDRALALKVDDLEAWIARTEKVQVAASATWIKSLPVLEEAGRNVAKALKSLYAKADALLAAGPTDDDPNAVNIEYASMELSDEDVEPVCSALEALEKSGQAVLADLDKLQHACAPFLTTPFAQVLWRLYGVASDDARPSLRIVSPSLSSDALTVGTDGEGNDDPPTDDGAPSGDTDDGDDEASTVLLEGSFPALVEVRARAAGDSNGFGWVYCARRVSDVEAAAEAMADLQTGIDDWVRSTDVNSCGSPLGLSTGKSVWDALVREEPKSRAETCSSTLRGKHPSALSSSVVRSLPDTVEGVLETLRRRSVDDTEEAKMQDTVSKTMRSVKWLLGFLARHRLSREQVDALMDALVHASESVEHSVKAIGRLEALGRDLRVTGGALSESRRLTPTGALRTVSTLAKRIIPGLDMAATAAAHAFAAHTYELLLRGNIDAAHARVEACVTSLSNTDAHGVPQGSTPGAREGGREVDAGGEPRTPDTPCLNVKSVLQTPGGDQLQDISGVLKQLHADVVAVRDMWTTMPVGAKRALETASNSLFTLPDDSILFRIARLVDLPLPEVRERISTAVSSATARHSSAVGELWVRLHSLLDLVHSQDFAAALGQLTNQPTANSVSAVFGADVLEHSLELVKTQLERDAEGVSTHMRSIAPKLGEMEGVLSPLLNSWQYSVSMLVAFQQAIQTSGGDMLKYTAVSLWHKEWSKSFGFRKVMRATAYAKSGVWVTTVRPVRDTSGMTWDEMQEKTASDDDAIAQLVQDNGAFGEVSEVDGDDENPGSSDDEADDGAPSETLFMQVSARHGARHQSLTAVAHSSRQSVAADFGKDGLHIHGEMDVGVDLDAFSLQRSLVRMYMNPIIGPFGVRDLTPKLSILGLPIRSLDTSPAGMLKQAFTAAMIEFKSLLTSKELPSRVSEYLVRQLTGERYLAAFWDWLLSSDDISRLDIVRSAGTPAESPSKKRPATTLASALEDVAALARAWEERVDGNSQCAGVSMGLRGIARGVDAVQRSILTSSGRLGLVDLDEVELVGSVPTSNELDADQSATEQEEAGEEPPNGSTEADAQTNAPSTGDPDDAVSGDGAATDGAAVVDGSTPEESVQESVGRCLGAEPGDESARTSLISLLEIEGVVRNLLAPTMVRFAIATSPNDPRALWRFLGNEDSVGPNELKTAVSHVLVLQARCVPPPGATVPLATSTELTNLQQSAVQSLDHLIAVARCSVGFMTTTLTWISDAMTDADHSDGARTSIADALLGKIRQLADSTDEGSCVPANVKQLLNVYARDGHGDLDADVEAVERSADDTDSGEETNLDKLGSSVIVAVDGDGADKDATTTTSTTGRGDEAVSPIEEVGAIVNRASLVAVVGLLLGHAAFALESDISILVDSSDESIGMLDKVDAVADSLSRLQSVTRLTRAGISTLGAPMDSGVIKSLVAASAVLGGLHRAVVRIVTAVRTVAELASSAEEAGELFAKSAPKAAQAAVEAAVRRASALLLDREALEKMVKGPVAMLMQSGAHLSPMGLLQASSSGGVSLHTLASRWHTRIDGVRDVSCAVYAALACVKEVGMDPKGAQVFARELCNAAADATAVFAAIRDALAALRPPQSLQEMDGGVATGLPTVGENEFTAASDEVVVEEDPEGDESSIEDGKDGEDGADGAAAAEGKDPDESNPPAEGDSVGDSDTGGEGSEPVSATESTAVSARKKAVSTSYLESLRLVVANIEAAGRALGRLSDSLERLARSSNSATLHSLKESAKMVLKTPEAKSGVIAALERQCIPASAAEAALDAYAEQWRAKLEETSSAWRAVTCEVRDLVSLLASPRKLFAVLQNKDFLPMAVRRLQHTIRDRLFGESAIGGMPGLLPQSAADVAEAEERALDKFAKCRAAVAAESEGPEQGSAIVAAAGLAVRVVTCAVDTTQRVAEAVAFALDDHHAVSTASSFVQEVELSRCYILLTEQVPSECSLPACRGVADALRAAMLTVRAAVGVRRVAAAVRSGVTEISRGGSHNADGGAVQATESLAQVWGEVYPVARDELSAVATGLHALSFSAAERLARGADTVLVALEVVNERVEQVASAASALRDPRKAALRGLTVYTTGVLSRVATELTGGQSVRERLSDRALLLLANPALPFFDSLRTPDERDRQRAVEAGKPLSADPDAYMLLYRQLMVSRRAGFILSNSVRSTGVDGGPSPRAAAVATLVKMDAEVSGVAEAATGGGSFAEFRAAVAGLVRLLFVAEGGMTTARQQLTAVEARAGESALSFCRGRSAEETALRVLLGESDLSLATDADHEEQPVDGSHTDLSRAESTGTVREDEGLGEDVDESTQVDLGDVSADDEAADQSVRDLGSLLDGSDGDSSSDEEGMADEETAAVHRRSRAHRTGAGVSQEAGDSPAWAQAPPAAHASVMFRYRSTHISAATLSEIDAAAAAMVASLRRLTLPGAAALALVMAEGGLLPLEPAEEAPVAEQTGTDDVDEAASGADGEDAADADGDAEPVAPADVGEALSAWESWVHANAPESDAWVALVRLLQQGQYERDSRYGGALACGSALKAEFPALAGAVPVLLRSRQLAEGVAEWMRVGASAGASYAWLMQSVMTTLFDKPEEAYAVFVRDERLGRAAEAMQAAVDTDPRAVVPEAPEGTEWMTLDAVAAAATHGFGVRWLQRKRALVSTRAVTTFGSLRSRLAAQRAREAMAVEQAHMDGVDASRVFRLRTFVHPAIVIVALARMRSVPAPPFIAFTLDGSSPTALGPDGTEVVSGTAHVAPPGARLVVVRAVGSTTVRAAALSADKVPTGQKARVAVEVRCPGSSSDGDDSGEEVECDPAQDGVGCPAGQRRCADAESPWAARLREAAAAARARGQGEPVDEGLGSEGLSAADDLPADTAARDGAKPSVLVEVSARRTRARAAARAPGGSSSVERAATLAEFVRESGDPLQSGVQLLGREVVPGVTLLGRAVKCAAALPHVLPDRVRALFRSVSKMKIKDVVAVAKALPDDLCVGVWSSVAREVRKAETVQSVRGLVATQSAAAAAEARAEFACVGRFFSTAGRGLASALRYIGGLAARVAGFAVNAGAALKRYGERAAASAMDAAWRALFPVLSGANGAARETAAAARQFGGALVRAGVVSAAWVGRQLRALRRVLGGMTRGMKKLLTGRSRTGDHFSPGAAMLAELLDRTFGAAVADSADSQDAMRAVARRTLAEACTGPDGPLAQLLDVLVGDPGRAVRGGPAGAGPPDGGMMPGAVPKEWASSREVVAALAVVADAATGGVCSADDAACVSGSLGGDGDDDDHGAAPVTVSGTAAGAGAEARAGGASPGPEAAAEAGPARATVVATLVAASLEAEAGVSRAAATAGAEAVAPLQQAGGQVQALRRARQSLARASAEAVRVLASVQADAEAAGDEPAGDGAAGDEASGIARADEGVDGDASADGDAGADADDDEDADADADAGGASPVGPGSSADADPGAGEGTAPERPPTEEETSDAGLVGVSATAVARAPGPLSERKARNAAAVAAAFVALAGPAGEMAGAANGLLEYLRPARAALLAEQRELEAGRPAAGPVGSAGLTEESVKAMVAEVDRAMAVLEACVSVAGLVERVGKGVQAVAEGTASEAGDALLAAIGGVPLEKGAHLVTTDREKGVVVLSAMSAYQAVADSGKEIANALLRLGAAVGKSGSRLLLRAARVAAEAVRGVSLSVAATGEFVARAVRALAMEASMVGRQVGVLGAMGSKSVANAILRLANMGDLARERMSMSVRHLAKDVLRGGLQLTRWMSRAMGDVFAAVRALPPVAGGMAALLKAGRALRKVLGDATRCVAKADLGALSRALAAQWPAAVAPVARRLEAVERILVARVGLPARSAAATVVAHTERVVGVLDRSFRRLAQVQLAKAEPSLQCRGGGAPTPQTVVSRDVLTKVVPDIVAVPIGPIPVMGVPIIIRIAVSARLDLGTESGRCEFTSLDGTAMQYFATGLRARAAVRASASVGVGVAWLGVGVGVEVDVVEVTVVPQMDVEPMRAAVALRVTPFVGALSGNIFAEVHVATLTFRRTLFEWTGFRRRLPGLCYAPNTAAFDPCPRTTAYTPLLTPSAVGVALLAPPRRPASTALCRAAPAPAAARSAATLADAPAVLFAAVSAGEENAPPALRRSTSLRALPADSDSDAGAVAVNGAAPLSAGGDTTLGDDAAGLRRAMEVCTWCFANPKLFSDRWVCPMQGGRVQLVAGLPNLHKVMNRVTRAVVSNDLFGSHIGSGSGLRSMAVCGERVVDAAPASGARRALSYGAFVAVSAPNEEARSVGAAGQGAGPEAEAAGTQTVWLRVTVETHKPGREGERAGMHLTFAAPAPAPIDSTGAGADDIPLPTPKTSLHSLSGGLLHNSPPIGEAPDTPEGRVPARVVAAYEALQRHASAVWDPTRERRSGPLSLLEARAAAATLTPAARLVPDAAQGVSIATSDAEAAELTAEAARAEAEAAAAARSRAVVVGASSGSGHTGADLGTGEGAGADAQAQAGGRALAREPSTASTTSTDSTDSSGSVFASALVPGAAAGRPAVSAGSVPLVERPFSSATGRCWRCTPMETKSTALGGDTQAAADAVTCPDFPLRRAALGSVSAAWRAAVVDQCLTKGFLGRAATPGTAEAEAQVRWRALLRSHKDWGRTVSASVCDERVVEPGAGGGLEGWISLQADAALFLRFRVSGDRLVGAPPAEGGACETELFDATGMALYPALRDRSVPELAERAEEEAATLGLLQTPCAPAAPVRRRAWPGASGEVLRVAVAGTDGLREHVDEGLEPSASGRCFACEVRSGRLRCAPDVGDAMERVSAAFGAAAPQDGAARALAGETLDAAATRAAAEVFGWAGSARRLHRHGARLSGVPGGVRFSVCGEATWALQAVGEKAAVAVQSLADAEAEDSAALGRVDGAGGQAGGVDGRNNPEAAADGAVADGAAAKGSGAGDVAGADRKGRADAEQGSLGPARRLLAAAEAGAPALGPRTMETTGGTCRFTCMRSGGLFSKAKRCGAADVEVSAELHPECMSLLRGAVVGSSASKELERTLDAKCRAAATSASERSPEKCGGEAATFSGHTPAKRSVAAPLCAFECHRSEIFGDEPCGAVVAIAAAGSGSGCADLSAGADVNGGALSAAEPFAREVRRVCRAADASCTSKHAYKTEGGTTTAAELDGLRLEVCAFECQESTGIRWGEYAPCGETVTVTEAEARGCSTFAPTTGPRHERSVHGRVSWANGAAGFGPKVRQLCRQKSARCGSRHALLVATGTREEVRNALQRRDTATARFECVAENGQPTGRSAVLPIRQLKNREELVVNAAPPSSLDAQKVAEACAARGSAVPAVAAKRGRFLGVSTEPTDDSRPAAAAVCAFSCMEATWWAQRLSGTPLRACGTVVRLTPAEAPGCDRAVEGDEVHAWSWGSAVLAKCKAAVDAAKVSTGVVCAADRAVLVAKGSEAEVATVEPGPAGRRQCVFACRQPFRVLSSTSCGEVVHVSLGEAPGCDEMRIGSFVEGRLSTTPFAKLIAARCVAASPKCSSPYAQFAGVRDDRTPTFMSGSVCVHGNAMHGCASYVLRFASLPKMVATTPMAAVASADPELLYTAALQDAADVYAESGPAAGRVGGTCPSPLDDPNPLTGEENSPLAFCAA